MQTTVQAPRDGVVERITVSEQEDISTGDLLLSLLEK
jgi:biotin carboxyl carrier protein